MSKHKYNNYKYQGNVSVLMLIAAIAIATAGTYTVAKISQDIDSTQATQNSFSNTLGVQAPIKPVILDVVYQKPENGTTGTVLPDADVASKFGVVIYSRTKMLSSLSSYKNNGFSGVSLVYLTALDRIAAPNDNYSSISKQKISCTETTYQPYSDNVDMDPGDFCEIQNAIYNYSIGQPNCLLEYPDVCPTENFFLHRTDSNYRYSKPSGNGYAYKPNPADPNYRKYVSHRALREIVGGIEVDANGTTRAHVAIGATGVFLDNLELSWSKILREGGQPKEFATSAGYANAVAGLVAQVHAALHNSSEAYNYPLWANMISDTHDGNSWDRYVSDKSLEGGVMEDFALDWGKGPYSSSIFLNEITQAEKWINSGRHFAAISQGNLYPEISWDGSGTSGNAIQEKFDKEARYALASYLLVADGSTTSFKYDDYYGDPNGSRSAKYQQFFDYPEYAYTLGKPLSTKQKVSDTPLVYKRNFECGSVTVDMTNFVGTIPQPNNCLADTSAPSVTITNPVSGASIAGNTTVNITATATDNVGVTKIESYVNSVLKCTTIGSSSSCVWKVPKKAGVIYAIDIKVYDAAGNIGMSSIKVVSK